MKLSAIPSKRTALIVATTLTAVLMSSGTAFAGDCKQVKFKVTNKLILPGTSAGVEIKVKKIAIVGNDGSWNENIGNKKIEYNKSHTTNSAG